MPAGSATSADELAEAIDRVVERWNASIPANRVRRINQPRYIDLRAALAEFTAAEICNAIEHYGASKWNRKNNAWMRFDNFIGLKRLTQWIEDAQNAADKAEAARLPADPRVAELQAQVAAKTAALSQAAADRKQFGGLAEDRRQELLLQASDELRQIRGPAYQPSDFSLRQQAIVIMKRTDEQ